MVPEMAQQTSIPSIQAMLRRYALCQKVKSEKTENNRFRVYKCFSGF